MSLLHHKYLTKISYRKRQITVLLQLFLFFSFYCSFSLLRGKGDLEEGETERESGRVGRVKSALRSWLLRTESEEKVLTGLHWES